MNSTSWLTRLLRFRKLNQHDVRTSHRRQQSRKGWGQVDFLEDRTLLSAIEFAPSNMPPTATDLTITKESTAAWVTQGMHTYTIIRCESRWTRSQ
ncbi:MAG: hypothetical protein R3C11_11170 [Planctomycetaceae bacterium]